MKVIKGLYYTENHEYVELKDGKAYIGITEFATEQLGGIVYVELPEVGDEFIADDSIAVVESVKTASDVYAPISGIVCEVNSELEDSPELLNKECYENYLVVLEKINEDELDSLMNSEEYEEFVEDLED